jgi:signal transduction histidine kinase
LTCGDPVLLERLTVNLVENARRYNVPAGSLRVTTEAVDGWATLVVENSGPPVSEGDLPALFEPFRRLGHRSAQDGFGLGLAIVDSIATVHGGAVAAQSREEGGLRVTVRLPAP